MTTLTEFKNESNDPRLQTFIGKKVIVGLFQFYNGEPDVRSQDFGEIIGFEDGMMVLQTKGRKIYFPIQYEALVLAPRGRYTLDATGEEIVNPDFLVSWRLDLVDEIEESQWRSNMAPHFASIVGQEWKFEYSYDKEYIEELIVSRGESFIGKTVLVGLREYKLQDDGVRKLVEQSQIYGKVVRVSLSEGVVIKLKDGSEHKLPPDISMLQSPPPGEYTLQSTGEVITNPDLMTMWTLNT